MARSKQLNPLAVAFGEALRQIRKAQGTPTKAVEDKDAGMSGSFYRLIESGRNNPSVSKASFLYHKFQGFGAKLFFEPLVFLISTIAASEEKTKNQKKMSRGKQLDENVRSIWSALPDDHRFKILLGRFLDPLKDRGISDKTLDCNLNIFRVLDKSASKIREIVTLANLDTEILQLLTRFDQYVPVARASEEYAITFFDKIPSIYEPLLDNFRKNLTEMPQAFVPEGSWDWEKDNRKDFQELIAVCFTDHVVAEENLKRYRYDYLWNKQFLKATFVLLDENGTENAKQQFWTTLKKVLKEDTNETAQEMFNSCNKQIENKTVFLKCGEDDRKQLLKLLKDESPSPEFGLNAMWFYRMKDCAVIGAAAQINSTNKKATGIKFLTFSDCKKALPILEKYYSESQS